MVRCWSRSCATAELRRAVLKFRELNCCRDVSAHRVEIGQQLTPIKPVGGLLRSFVDRVLTYDRIEFTSRIGRSVFGNRPIGHEACHPPRSNGYSLVVVTDAHHAVAVLGIRRPGGVPYKSRS